LEPISIPHQPISISHHWKLALEIQAQVVMDLASTLTLAVARGERFLDRDTTAGTVLYLAREEKRAELR
jgi:hypothetical protein